MHIIAWSDLHARMSALQLLLLLRLLAPFSPAELSVLTRPLLEHCLVAIINITSLLIEAESLEIKRRKKRAIFCHLSCLLPALCPLPHSGVSLWLWLPSAWAPVAGGGSFCHTAPGILSLPPGDYLCWLVLSIPLILSANLVGSPWGHFSFNLNTIFWTCV